MFPTRSRYYTYRKLEIKEEEIEVLFNAHLEIILRNYGKGMAALSSTGCPPDSVDVGLAILREVVV